MLTSAVQLGILAHSLQPKGQSRLSGELFRDESLSSNRVRPHDFFGSVRHPANSLDRVCRPKFSSRSECRKSMNSVFPLIPAMGRFRILQCDHNSFPLEFDDGCYGSCLQLSPKLIFTSGHIRFVSVRDTGIGEDLRGVKSMECGKHQVAHRPKEVTHAA
jgi:hypothetical protein